MVKALEKGDAGVFNWLKRFGLRCFTLFELFYLFFGNYVVVELMSQYPFPINWLGRFLQTAEWARIVPWIGEGLFGHAVAVKPGFDTLFDYLNVGIILAIALVSAVVWTCIDRDREHERKLYEATRFLVRYALAGIMLEFGLIKTLHGQFPFPGPVRLMEPVGDLAPDALMWTFMGYSSIYQNFTELAEVAGAILLLFRRTTTLGALILVGDLVDVLMIDISYYVIVRVGATLFLFMAIFLLLPAFQRLMNAVLGYQALPAIQLKRAWPKPWMQPVSIILKALVISCLIVPPLMSTVNWAKSASASEKRMPMQGLYRVEDFREGLKRQDSSAAEGKWERVAIEFRATNQAIDPRARTDYLMAVRTASDVMQYYALRQKGTGPSHGLFKLLECAGYSCSSARSLNIVLRYVIEGTSGQTGARTSLPTELKLEGAIRGVPISMRLKRVDTSQYALVGTPFHFIEPDNAEWNI